MTQTCLSRIARAALAAVAFGTAAATLSAQAGTGRLEGRVRDSAGVRIPNARVIVVGSAFSAPVDTAGNYAINGIPAGTYSVRATYVGYRPVQTDSIRILAGQVTRLDFVLVGAPVQLDQLVVTGSRQALVPRDAVSSKQIITGSSVNRLPVDRIQQALALQGGFGRGTRGEQGVTYIDGVPVRNFPNTEAYDRIVENPFLDPRYDPLSTFGIDVDRASYSNVRRFISQGRHPEKDAVRIEEMINYFAYDYPAPAANSEHPFTVTTEVAAAPWNPAHRVVRIGLQARKLDTSTLPANNLTFLLDVSGSMEPWNRLPLVKAAMRLLVDQLRKQDRVAIVVYAGDAGVRLRPTSGADKTTILDAIDGLEAGGSTNGSAGLRLAYDVARQSHLDGGNNRIILATDGDFNVGLSSDSDMERLIEAERRGGTFLTVLGVGYGNLKDSKLEKIADAGNGNYAYLDNLLEAHKVLVQEMGGTLVTVAKDVKLQVEFNPATVQAYRLIGYEDRLLRSEDFADDEKDAGDMGAGHSVTALYEITPAGVTDAAPARGIEPLRYQTPSVIKSHPGDELLFVKVRYKDPDAKASKLLAVAAPGHVGKPSTDFTFAMAVASFGMILRESQYRGAATLDGVLDAARQSLGADSHGYRAGFLSMVESYQKMNVAVDR